MFTRTLLILSVLLLTACNNTYTWRQKLTVTVQTPDGEVSASSVTEVTKIQSDSFWMPIEARGVQSSLRGEAVALEVTPGRYLFVLLDGQDQLALRAFPQFTYQRDGEFRQWARSIERHRGSGELPPEYYPTMVTFENIDDPTSLGIVDPTNIATTFGVNYALTGLTVTITEDPSEIGTITNILSWLRDVGMAQANVKGLPEGGISRDAPTPAVYWIAPSDFLTELYR
ncbi:MAG: hypothetical protein AAFN63_04800 [Pseudomonadota bacterium]